MSTEYTYPPIQERIGAVQSPFAATLIQDNGKTFSIQDGQTQECYSWKNVVSRSFRKLALLRFFEVSGAGSIDDIVRALNGTDELKRALSLQIRDQRLFGDRYLERNAAGQWQMNTGYPMFPWIQRMPASGVAIARTLAQQPEGEAHDPTPQQHCERCGGPCNPRFRYCIACERHLWKTI